MSVEANKALVLRWFSELDNRNFAAIDELLSVDYVDHNQPLPNMPPGREGVLQASIALATAFPDAKHTIEDQTAEGDKVMTRVTVRGTFQSEILGYQPTGRTVEVTGIAVHRIVDGKLVEHWAQVDMAAFVEQLGLAADLPDAD
jgi:steroid delta-isomerase-like uncharacterized protein